MATSGEWQVTDLLGVLASGVDLAAQLLGPSTAPLSLKRLAETKIGLGHRKLRDAGYLADSLRESF